jgi:hypothetical protein
MRHRVAYFPHPEDGIAEALVSSPNNALENALVVQKMAIAATFETSTQRSREASSTAGMPGFSRKVQCRVAQLVRRPASLATFAFAVVR